MEKFWKAADSLQGKERINELLWYDVQDRNLFIHLDRNDKIPLFKKRSVFKNGLSLLADQLGEKQELQHIGFIIAGSWILKDNPSLAKAIGFKLYDRGSDEENIEEMRKDGMTTMKHGISTSNELLAAMSREDFLTRPWQKSGIDSGSEGSDSSSS